MSDRIKGFTVVLGDDFKDEDAELIKTAIEMIKGVIHVEPEIVGAKDYMDRTRIKNEIRTKFYNFLKEEL